MFTKTRKRPTLRTNEVRACYLCVNNKKAVDFRDTALLSRFISLFMKIAPRRRSGLCAKHQRQVATAIKRSRQSGLMPYLLK